ncbi:MAG: methyltransferase domain-containing protein [Thermomicrobiales bacterium]
MSAENEPITNDENIRGWSIVSESEHEAFGDEGDFARRHLLTPSMLELIGPPAGRRILDAGAGNGYLSRILARTGAEVTALEPAESGYRYIAAREESNPLGISCVQQDLSTMRQYSDVFDIVVANMVLLDIPDFEAAIANCLNALKPAGSFIFSIEHPFTDTADRSGLPFKVGDYFSERAMPRQVAHNFHRTIETYVDALAERGAVIERIREPRLPADVAERHPERAWAHWLPAFIIFKARKVLTEDGASRRV